MSVIAGGLGDGENLAIFLALPGQARDVRYFVTNKDMPQWLDELYCRVLVDEKVHLPSPGRWIVAVYVPGEVQGIVGGRRLHCRVVIGDPLRG